MFGRRYLKLTSSTRVLINKSFIAKNKLVLPTNECQQPFRLLRATSAALRNDSDLNKFKLKSTTSSLIKEKQQKSVPPKLYPGSTTNNDELLEKMIAGLSRDIDQKNRVYRNDLMRVINKVKEMNFSNRGQGLLLIRCCTELLADEAPASRMALVEQVWNTIKPHTKFDVAHYHELLNVYIANNRTLTVTSFINQMSPVKPTITTYELILRALGEAGDLNQATEVISNMKNKDIPATESIFNSLIVCQGKTGNVQNIQDVLTMMKGLKIEPSASTITAKVRALAMNKKQQAVIEEMKLAARNGIKFDEEHVMEVVKTLAVMGNYEIIPQVLKFLPQEILNTPSISSYMQSITTQLVFQNHPIAALEIYKSLPLPSFGPKDDQGLHGRSLVRDCVRASMPSSIIALITQELMSSGRNPIAIQNASEAALQLGKIPLALDMFTHMKQVGMPLRPHYFWPILLFNSKNYGEKGIMNILNTMVTMDVKPDYDTIMNYTLPYVSFTSPQNLMKKFLDAGLNVSDVLTPMMETLLNTGQVRAASELCELFKGKVDAQKLLSPLLKGFLLSSDLKSTIYALEDIASKAEDKNKDWVGRFLCVFITNKKVQADLTDFMEVAKALSKTKLRISSPAVDFCMTRLPETHSNMEDVFSAALIDISDERVVDDGDICVVGQMPHPKQMKEEELKAHLNELDAKGMNSRGVLRKLLQQYCRQGNLPAAREIADRCQKEGVFLSAGMRAAIFDLHVKLGELELAELALADLNKTSPNFNLDEYKVIDFATLMVYRKEINKAFDLINEQSKKRHVVGGRGIEMNCWRLLDATAAHGQVEQARKMLDLLTSLGYCKPSNALLGPMIRSYLVNNNINEAVQEFTRLANKYNRTPLKHELLCHILQGMSDGQTEDNFLSNEKADGRSNRLARAVLQVDKKVHGAGNVQLTLIAALADVSYTKTLRKMFLDPTVKFHPDALVRRCERFAQEKKAHALKNIAECAKGLRHIDTAEIYDLIMDVYQREDNHAGALEYWNTMQEQDITPSPKFVRGFCSLLKANNQPIPVELSILLGKQASKSAN